MLLYLQFVWISRYKYSVSEVENLLWGLVIFEGNMHIATWNIFCTVTWILWVIIFVNICYCVNKKCYPVWSRLSVRNYFIIFHKHTL